MSSFTTGKFWDGISDAPPGARDILVQDGFIKSVAEKIPIPEGAKGIDLRDRM
ncbi:hypothetical protein [Methanoregula sp.]|uniref:hypothetical protein n=1 Tax=Methanoregula sp. TaxID=2052170 RepID=UPI003569B01B